MAEEMGIELLTEEQYRALQKHGPFDEKTSSWLLIPAPIRKLAWVIDRFGASWQLNLH